MKRKAGWFAPALFGLFFVSGAAGLAYQVLWAKAFGAGIGHEFPATLAVVTAFMSGLAAGAFFYDRIFGRVRVSVPLYVLLELWIGIWGAVTFFLTPSANRFIIELLGPTPNASSQWLIVFAVVFVFLVPSTAAMGATLPALEHALAEIHPQRVAFLYAANTAGAMIGSLAAAFFLMPSIGIGRSILALAGCNVLCAFLAFLLPNPSPKERNSTRAPRRLAVQLFVTGLLGIGFEIVAIRALSHILENTVYTFAVVLAVYLLGTWLGALFMPRTHAPEQVLALLAGTILVSGLVLRFLPSLYLTLRQTFSESVPAVALNECLVGATVLFLPTFFMGAVFRDFAEQSLKFKPSLGWSLLVNGLGAAVAPASFGLLAIPHIGIRGSFALVAIGYAALTRRFALAMIPISLLAIPWLTKSTDLVAREGQKIVHHREGVMASVTVLESTNGSRVLKVNNRFQMGGTAARVAESRHADIPLLLHPRPQRALFIGLGTGITFATAAHYPGLIADGVELLPEIVAAMPFFQMGPDDQPGKQLAAHIADGRRFVLTTTNIYDVIVGDLFHPAQDGAAFLYTKEHFQAVRDRLASEGLYCQWLPLFQMDLKTLDIVAYTFASVFPNAELWLLRFNIDTPVVGLIGWKSPVALPPDMVEAKAATSEDLQAHLRTVALGDTLRLLGCRLGPARSGSPINTDDRPIVLFEAPQITFHLHDEPGGRLLTLLDRYPVSGDSKLQRYAQARNIYLSGLLLEEQGQIADAVSRYIESARVSSEFTSGYAQALGIATTLARKNPAQARDILNQLIDAQPERPVARQLLERLQ